MKGQRVRVSRSVNRVGSKAYQRAGSKAYQWAGPRLSGPVPWPKGLGSNRVPSLVLTSLKLKLDSPNTYLSLGFGFKLSWPRALGFVQLSLGLEAWPRVKGFWTWG